MSSVKPLFPINVKFFEDDDEWVLDNEGEIASNLEWFDSRDPSENAGVIDSLGRSVRVKVEKLNLIEFFWKKPTKWSFLSSKRLYSLEATEAVGVYMKFFQSGDIIKIPGKTSFDDLSLKEIGLMIDADSSLSPEGNDFFSSSALDEFLHSAILKRADLKAIQKKVLDNIYLGVAGSKVKKINTEYLQKLSAELRET